MYMTQIRSAGNSPAYLTDHIIYEMHRKWFRFEYFMYVLLIELDLPLAASPALYLWL